MNTYVSALNFIALIYVSLPLVFFIATIIYYSIGKSISKEGINKIIEFSKWYLVSVAIVFASKMLEAGFSERETGLKEMQVYDKYVETILDADNIEARWKLAEYFAAVTPTERLRERWVIYKEIINDDYTQFKELSAKADILSNMDSLSSEDKNKLAMVQKSIAPFEKKLVNSYSGNWAIVFSGDTSYEAAEWEQNKLLKDGVDQARIVFRNGNFRTISKSFNTLEEANTYHTILKPKLRSDVYIVNIEKWCPKLEFNGNYYECN